MTKNPIKYLCVASLTQSRTRLTCGGRTDVNNCSLHLTLPPPLTLSLTLSLFVYRADSQSRANLVQLQLCSTNWILEVSVPCSWMNRIKCGNLKLWIFLMLPTVLAKHKLPCGLMKYISLPQNDFNRSKTQNESWMTSASPWGECFSTGQVTQYSMLMIFYMSLAAAAAAAGLCLITKSLFK